MDHDIAKLLAPYSPEIHALTAQLRELLHSLLPGMTESVDLPAGLIAFSYGPGYRGVVCTIICSKKELKLGIAGGAELPDPAGLLRGAGKVHRHVPVRRAEDILQPVLEDLVRAAAAACRRLLGQAQ